MIGVDKDPQPRYPGEFLQMDALEFLDRLIAGEFEQPQAIAGSPPCQTYSSLAHFATPGKHVDIIAPLRDRFNALCVPWVIENVPGSERQLLPCFTLCGTIFRLGVDGAELRRHRHFATNWGLRDLVPGCDHGWSARVLSVHGGKARDRSIRSSAEVRTMGVYGDCIATARQRRSKPKTLQIHGSVVETDPLPFSSRTGNTAQQNVEHNKVREVYTVEDARAALGCHWMTMKGLSQCIPPAYCKWIGDQLIEVLG